MSSNVNERKNNSRSNPRLSNAVYDVSEIDGLINIKGWLKLKNAERAGVTLVLKMRKCAVHYLIPYQLLDDSTCEVNLDVNQYHINIGILIDYFKYVFNKISINIEED